MKSKIIIPLLMSGLMMMNIALAEQPAAEEYRRIFQTGTFYLEYKDANESKVLAAFDGKRMERIIYLKMNWATYLNPLGALFGGSGSKRPDVLHQKGKYYQFIDEDVAIMLPESKLNDRNLDPRQGWNSIEQKLAVPNELAVFYWDDPYSKKPGAVSAPKFISSEKKVLNKAEYECDRYVSEVRSMADGEIVQIVYEMFYADGKLVEAHSSILQNGIEYPINAIKIKKLQGEVPNGAFKVDKKTKVYAAGTGDILDLIQQPEQVEILGALK